MAIDVEKEISDFVTWVKVGTATAPPMGRAVDDVKEKLAYLVTRAVADAKLKQMEADCKAVCVKCKFGFNSLDHSMFCQNIRTAFAATEPTKEGNEIIEETLADGWPKNQQIAEQCIDARQRFDKAAVELAEECCVDCPCHEPREVK